MDANFDHARAGEACLAPTLVSVCTYLPTYLPTYLLTYLPTFLGRNQNELETMLWFGFYTTMGLLLQLGTKAVKITGLKRDKILLKLSVKVMSFLGTNLIPNCNQQVLQFL